MISAAMPSPMSNTITNSVLAAGHDGKDSRTSRTTGEMSKQNHGPLFFFSFEDRQRSRSLEELGPPDSPKGLFSSQSPTVISLPVGDIATGTPFRPALVCKRQLELKHARPRPTHGETTPTPAAEE